MYPQEGRLHWKLHGGCTEAAHDPASQLVRATGTHCGPGTAIGKSRAWSLGVLRHDLVKVIHLALAFIGHGDEVASHRLGMFPDGFEEGLELVSHILLHLLRACRRSGR